MKPRTKLILLVLASVLLLPVASIYGAIGDISDINADGRLVEGNFMKHELNKEIVARIPRWHAGIEDTDVTSLFSTKMNEDEYKGALSLNGYSCGSSDRSPSICQAEAGYDLVCRRKVVLMASFDDASMLKVVKARYHLICL